MVVFTFFVFEPAGSETSTLTVMRTVMRVANSDLSPVPTQCHVGGPVA